MNGFGDGGRDRDRLEAVDKFATVLAEVPDCDEADDICSSVDERKRVLSWATGESCTSKPST